MKIDGNQIRETYQTASKVYTTDGKECTWSYFAQHMFCRHLVMYRVTNALPVFDKSAIHQSLLKKADQNADTSSPNNLDNLSPPSPGLEMVLQEERQRKKAPKQKEKYNLAWDIAKEMVEILSLQDTQRFRSLLNASKNFVVLLRHGMTDELSNYLNNPDMYVITQKNTETDNIPQSDENESVTKRDTSASNNTAVDITVLSAVYSVSDCNRQKLPSGYNEIPLRHRSFFSSECVIKTIKATGGCLFAAIAHKIYNDQDLYPKLRWGAQQFLLQTWDEMNLEEYIQLPLNIRIFGNPDKLRLNTYEQYKQFLGSEESMTSYSESDIEIQNLANFLNILIHVFAFNKNSSNWHDFQPMQNIVNLGKWAFPTNCNTVVLYHELRNHYDVIVSRPNQSLPQSNISAFSSLTGMDQQSSVERSLQSSYVSDKGNVSVGSHTVTTEDRLTRSSTLIEFRQPLPPMTLGSTVDFDQVDLSHIAPEITPNSSMELPEIDFIPKPKDKNDDGKLIFQQKVPKRGRPQKKREGSKALHKKKKKSVFDYIDGRCEIASGKKRAYTRGPYKNNKNDSTMDRNTSCNTSNNTSSRSYVRGPYKKKQKRNESDTLETSAEIKRRPRRAPVTRNVLSAEYLESLVNVQDKCYTCDFPLNPLLRDGEDKVVKCNECGDTIHKSCIRACRKCEEAEV